MRLINRLLAALLALAIVVVCALVVIEVVAQRMGREPAIVHWHSAQDWASRTTWVQGSIRVVCIGLAVLGLILLIAELKPSRPKRLPIRSDATDAAYTRRGVAATLHAAVTDVDGISSAHVDVKRRRIRVTATSRLAQPGGAATMRGTVTEAAQRRLDDLELVRPPALAVRVTTRSR